MPSDPYEHHELYDLYLAVLPPEDQELTVNGVAVTDPEEFLETLPEEELHRLVPLETAAEIIGIPRDMFDAFVAGYMVPNVVHVVGDVYATSVSEIVWRAKVLRVIARKHLDDFQKTCQFSDGAATAAYEEVYGED